MYDIGKRIKLFRERRGLSQKNFAARINAKNTTVSNWEKGIARPDVDTLALICGVLDVSADELLDLRLSPDNLSPHERNIVMEYRKKPELQLAVNILLGVKPGKNDS
jgi:transcriptional regulator with XRE-family HTH domain